MRSFFVALAAATILLGPFTSDSLAKVTIKERTTTYSVSGKTGKDIYQQIVRKGPKLRGRKGAHVATTTFNYDFRNIRTAIRGNRCVVTNIDVVMNFVYRTPKWTGRGSPEVRRAWKAFEGHIRRHEDKHRDIAIEYARRLESGALRLTGDVRRGCSDFRAKAESLGRRERAWHDRKQQAFDSSWFGDGGKQFKYDRALIAAR